MEKAHTDDNSKYEEEISGDEQKHNQETLIQDQDISQSDDSEDKGTSSNYFYGKIVTNEQTLDQDMTYVS